MIGTVLFYLKVQVILFVITATLPLAIYLSLILQLRSIDILAHDGDSLVPFLCKHELLLPVSGLIIKLCFVVHYLPVDFLSFYSLMIQIKLIICIIMCCLDNRL